MNMEKTTERYPIRYYSMITVAKDFISQANGPLAEGAADWKAADFNGDQTLNVFDLCQMRYNLLKQEEDSKR